MRLIKKKNSEIEMQYELLSQYCNKLEEKCERIYGGGIMSADLIIL